MKLASSSAERDLYESLAEIYSIIVTLDGLEKAYIRDAISESEYTETCARLLKQYKSTLSDEAVAREFVDLDTFKRTWGVGLSGPVVTSHTNMRSWNVPEPLNVSGSAYRQLSSKLPMALIHQATARPARLPPAVPLAVLS